jgi:hypothetical protein
MLFSAALLNSTLSTLRLGIVFYTFPNKNSKASLGVQCVSAITYGIEKFFVAGRQGRQGTMVGFSRGRDWTGECECYEKGLTYNQGQRGMDTANSR